MVEVSERAALAGRRLRDEVAGPRFTVQVARLYSQFVRLRTGQETLRTFSGGEAVQRLVDAVRLTDASLAARERGESDWRIGLRRVGELLEWLAQPETNPEGLPLTMLGAAAYELAGYPARAASLAMRETEEQDAPLLRSLLQHDFQRLLDLAVEVGSTREETLLGATPLALESAEISAADLHEVIVVEVASALAIVAAELRWGGGRRTVRALEKLDAAAAAATTVSDPYEWLLLRLCSEAAREAVSSSLRNHVNAIAEAQSEVAREVLERYVRLAYVNQQITVWPSQARGLSRVAERGSFALCTPTGSGKTRVAEVALIAGLFEDERAEVLLPPLCLYIVPTRSLAAEVEARFSRVLRRAGGSRALTVTGLYGGTDWGADDEWLLTGEPAVLICTQEKCEALVRFAGELILSRLRLVIVDEAHEIRLQAHEVDTFDSRALRLESLVSRLRARLPDTRFIAMSAVAQNLEGVLARWISGDRASQPVRSDYRSTRQLVGRLQCSTNRSTRIEYDVLDAQPLAVGNMGDEAAYVPQPFPRHPPAPEFRGPKKGLAPFALWAAIQLAGAPGDRRQTVLISIVEGISNFIGWCAALLEEEWVDEDLPEFFVQPRNDSDDARLWDSALRATEDFFGPESREMRLLRRGIVVHHGRMPGRLPRLLVEVVERRIARVVIATSTLTQGVNLPFETILIPGLRRQSGAVSSQEFLNLIGRAGRPGVATEGQALVLMLEGLSRWQRDRDLADYRAVTDAWVHDAVEEAAPDSPLASLINTIWHRWPGTEPEDFETWLERAAVGSLLEEADLQSPVDVLDGLLLASLEESEPGHEVEEALRRVWSQTFARYASAEEERLERAFIARGRAVAARFPDEAERLSIYRTSLPPRDALALGDTAPILLEHLQTGTDYWRWSQDQRLAYIERAVEITSAVEQFRVRENVGRSTASWRDVLRWWLHPSSGPRLPTATQTAAWHDFVATQFSYRFAWGVAAMLLVRSASAEDPALDFAGAAEVPSAALWLRDLILWGTLDPVAAHLLSRRVADDRPSAARLAAGYYSELDPALDGDPLIPAAIRVWARAFEVRASTAPVFTVPAQLPARVEARIEGQIRRWRVVPRIQNETIGWFDVAGFLLGSSELPQDWNEEAGAQFDFVLDAGAGRVEATPYL